MKRSLLLLPAALILLPQSAQTATTDPTFCQSLSQQISFLNNKYGTPARKLKDVKSNLRSQGQQEAGLKSRQLAWDQISDERIHQIEQINGLTSAQRAALVTFRNRFHKAVEQKRAAHQVLLDSFRQNNSTLTSLHQTQIEAITQSRNQALLTAAENSQTQCKDHLFSDTKIRNSYNQKIRDAQKVFRLTLTQENTSFSGNDANLIANYGRDEQNLQVKYIDDLKQALEELKKSF